MLLDLSDQELRTMVKSLDDVSNEVSNEWDMYCDIENSATNNVDPGEIDFAFFYVPVIDIEDVEEKSTQ